MAADMTLTAIPETLEVEIRCGDYCERVPQDRLGRRLMFDRVRGYWCETFYITRDDIQVRLT